jgi:glycosyltransferase involved in cell wall biosynthesis
MKVLLVSSSSGSAGGGETYLLYLAIGLTQLGHRVHAICSTSPEMDKLAEGLGKLGEVRRVEFISTYQRRTRSLGAALDFEQQRRLRRTFQEFCPEIVHINQQVAEDALDLVLAARNCGIPFLSTIHVARSARSLGARFGRLRDFVTSQVLRRISGVHIAVAERARRELATRFTFLAPHQVRVVLNGVVFAEPNVGAKDSTRARWGVAPGEIVLGTVGRLDAQKAPDFSLEIIAALRRKGLPVRYVWIGDGYMRTSFKEQAQNLGIADVVRVDGWRDDVPDCLQALDVLAMPSNFEGMPLALLEAMAAGLCCCASDVDGMGEAIQHGLTGYLCAPGNLDNWCQQLEALIKDPSLRIATGSRARDVARQRFGVNSMADDTVKVYEDVMRRYYQVNGAAR